MPVFESAQRTAIRFTPSLKASVMNVIMSEAYFPTHSEGQSNLTSHFGTKHGCILYSQAGANCLKSPVRVTD